MTVKQYILHLAELTKKRALSLTTTIDLEKYKEKLENEME